MNSFPVVTKKCTTYEYFLNLDPCTAQGHFQHLWTEGRHSVM